MSQVISKNKAYEYCKDPANHATATNLIAIIAADKSLRAVAEHIKCAVALAMLQAFGVFYINNKAQVQSSLEDIQSISVDDEFLNKIKNITSSFNRRF